MDTPLMTKLIRVVDFETTGFPPRADVVEIGVTDSHVETDHATVVPGWSSICQPDREIQHSAMGVHHITPSMVENTPHHKDALARIADPRAHYYVAHHAKFEAAFFSLPRPWVCSMKLARKVWPNAPDHKAQTLRYWLNVDGDNNFDINLASPPHRAGPDSYITAFIFRRLLISYGFDVMQMMRDQQQSQLLTTISFGKHKGMPWSGVPSDYLKWILNNPQAEDDVRFTAQFYLDKRRGVVQ